MQKADSNIPYRIDSIRPCANMTLQMMAPRTPEFNQDATTTITTTATTTTTTQMTMRSREIMIQ